MHDIDSDAKYPQPTATQKEKEVRVAAATTLSLLAGFLPKNSNTTVKASSNAHVKRIMKAILTPGLFRCLADPIDFVQKSRSDILSPTIIWDQSIRAQVAHYLDSQINVIESNSRAMMQHLESMDNDNNNGNDNKQEKNDDNDDIIHSVVPTMKKHWDGWQEEKFNFMCFICQDEVIVDDIFVRIFNQTKPFKLPSRIPSESKMSFFLFFKKSVSLFYYSLDWRIYACVCAFVFCLVYLCVYCRIYGIFN